MNNKKEMIIEGYVERDLAEGFSDDVISSDWHIIEGNKILTLCKKSTAKYRVLEISSRELFFSTTCMVQFLDTLVSSNISVPPEILINEFCEQLDNSEKTKLKQISTYDSRKEPSGGILFHETSESKQFLLKKIVWSIIFGQELDDIKLICNIISLVKSKKCFFVFENINQKNILILKIKISTKKIIDIPIDENYIFLREGVFISKPVNKDDENYTIKHGMEYPQASQYNLSVEKIIQKKAELSLRKYVLRDGIKDKRLYVSDIDNIDAEELIGAICKIYDLKIKRIEDSLHIDYSYSSRKMIKEGFRSNLVSLLPKPALQMISDFNFENRNKVSLLNLTPPEIRHLDKQKYQKPSSIIHLNSVFLLQKELKKILSSEKTLDYSEINEYQDSLVSNMLLSMLLKSIGNLNENIPAPILNMHRGRIFINNIERKGQEMRCFSFVSPNGSSWESWAVYLPKKTF
jgi:hypothetical protein